jgi:hypothetical protein
VKGSAIVVVAVLADAAAAGGLDDDVIGGRAVGRAGTGTVSDDGAAALVTSPAALARRGDRRVQLGTALIDDDLEYVSDDPDAPIADDQRAPRFAPAFAVAAGAGPIVVGAGVIVDGAGRTLSAPRAFPPDTVERVYPYRYAGLAAESRRRTVALGAAARVTDWLALGATATLADVAITERRRIWAGFAGREDIGSAQRDVEIATDAVDRAVPGAAFGAFVAPAFVPIEAAVSIAWTNAAHAGGTAQIAAADPTEIEIVPTGGDPTTRIDLPMPMVIRAGARYLGDRYAVEAGVDAWRITGGRATSWTVDNVSIADAPTLVVRPLDNMASRIRPRSRIAARAAVDVELLAGFLWITGGYAWRNRGQDDADLAPSTADLGGHTVALGIEVATAGITATVGWARTFASRRTLVAGNPGLDNPFEAGDAPTGIGRYDTGRDLVGISIEVAGE